MNYLKKSLGRKTRKSCWDVLTRTFLYKIVEVHISVSAHGIVVQLLFMFQKIRAVNETGRN